jgi:beta-lactamase class A
MALMLTAPVQAQSPRTLEAKAEALVAFWNGTAEAGELFAPSFLAAVPPERISAIATQLRADLGSAQRVRGVVASGETNGIVTFVFERGELDTRLVVAGEPPHLISGLLITATRPKGDSYDQLSTDLNALPGAASLAVARLDQDAPVLLASLDPSRAAAIGSVFKLFILAELQRQVSAGERRWTDVVPLSSKSLPSGFLQTWPTGAPLTLHSLAALMISQSDNSATDTLLNLLGREKVEAVLPRLGIRNTAANRRFLSTFEAFALKAGDQELTRRWLATDEAGRRRMLGQIAATAPERIDVSRLQARPNQIATIEWFASADDLVRTLDWLRRNGGKELRDILAINPGLPRPAARDFTYWAYKGGSETGVIAMTFLVQSKGGAWYALAASWNDPDAALDEARFAMLMNRAVALLPD